MPKTTKFDVVDYLKTEGDIAGYLSAILEEGDPDLLVRAIGDIARARSINKISKSIGVNRESLYKSLSGSVKVNFDTIYKVIDSLGFKISILPKNTKKKACIIKNLTHNPSACIVRRVQQKSIL
jgi:probable addiction module antidote protein